MGAWFGFFIHRFFVLPAGWEGRASARPRASRRLPLPVLRETNHRLEGERPCEPPSALRAEGKWCRDPRTARPLSPHSRSRAKHLECGGKRYPARRRFFGVRRSALGVRRSQNGGVERRPDGQTLVPHGSPRARTPRIEISIGLSQGGRGRPLPTAHTQTTH